MKLNTTLLDCAKRRNFELEFFYTNLEGEALECRQILSPPMLLKNVRDDILRHRLGRREKQVIHDGVPAINHRQPLRSRRARPFHDRFALRGL